MMFFKESGHNWRDQLARTDKFQAEGAAAAHEGKTREDCPYQRRGIPAQDEAWNFWVWGNENEQGKMLQKYMADHGEPSFYCSTAGSPEEMKALEAWSKKAEGYRQKMRAERGWK